MQRLLCNVLERLETGEKLLSPQEALECASFPAEDTADLLAVAGLVRSRRSPNVFTCGIINAKSGRCPENCAFCAQSAHYTTNTPVYPLVDADTLVQRAEALAEAGALRYGIVTSGTQLNEQDLDALCLAAERIVRETGMHVCGSLGMLTPERATRLKQAGFTRYHHNLETSASHFSSICSTHAYEDDLETVRAAKRAGLRVCSGGILGLGESPAQRVELALTLEELDVDSIPLNLLNAIPGTPLATMPILSPMEALRSIALFRLLHPHRDILVCGGREHVLRQWQSWLFAAGANGLMTGNYLTTTGCAFEADNAMLAELALPRVRARQVTGTPAAQVSNMQTSTVQASNPHPAAQQTAAQEATAQGASPNIQNKNMQNSMTQDQAKQNIPGQALSGQSSPAPGNEGQTPRRQDREIRA